MWFPPGVFRESILGLLFMAPQTLQFFDVPLHAILAFTPSRNFRGVGFLRLCPLPFCEALLIQMSPTLTTA